MTPSEGFVDTDGVRLHYLEWGGSGPPAVLLHATGFLARLWEPIAQRLAERCHVYAYDARGHGDSDKPALSEGGYNWEGLAADLKAFLDALALRGVLAVAHSSGGAATALVAARHARYISSAVLIEPTIFPPLPVERADERREELFSGAARRRMVWPSRQELFRTYRRRPTFARWSEDVLRLYAEHGTRRRRDGRIELKCPGRIEAAMYRNSLSTDAWELLPELRCPTLVLRGQHTESMLAKVAQGVAERIEGARLVTAGGAGHFLPMERPDYVAEQILTFLDEGAPLK